MEQWGGSLVHRSSLTSLRPRHYPQPLSRVSAVPAAAGAGLPSINRGHGRRVGEEVSWGCVRMRGRGREKKAGAAARGAGRTEARRGAAPGSGGIEGARMPQRRARVPGKERVPGRPGAQRGGGAPGREAGRQGMGGDKGKGTGPGLGKGHERKGAAGGPGVRSACGRGGAAVVTLRFSLKDQARGAGREGEVGEPV